MSYANEETETSLTREQESSLVTTTMFWRRWTRAHILNSPLGSECSGLDSLSCEGQDVVVVGGGWTLDDTIPWLRERQRDVTIFCASQATRALHRAGIVPDVMLSLEHADISYQLDEVPPCAVRCHVLPLWSHEEIFCRFPNVCFAVQGTGLLLEDLFECQGRDSYLRPGSSVGSGMIHLAAKLGARRLLLLGMDFCLRGSRTYASGCADGGEEIEIVDGKYNSGAMSKWSKIHGDNPDFQRLYGWSDITHLRGQSGEMLPCLHPVALAHSHVEEAIAMHPDLEVVNCSLGGAHIEGAAVRAVDDVVLSAGDEMCVDIDIVELDPHPVMLRLEQARDWARAIRQGRGVPKLLESRPDLAMLLPTSICKYAIHVDKNLLTIHHVDPERLPAACEQIGSEVEEATTWALEQF